MPVASWRSPSSAPVSLVETDRARYSNVTVPVTSRDDTNSRTRSRTRRVSGRGPRESLAAASVMRAPTPDVPITSSSRRNTGRWPAGTDNAIVSAEGSLEPGSQTGARTSVTSTGAVGAVGSDTDDVCENGGGGADDDPADDPDAGNDAGGDEGADVEGGVSREVPARSPHATPMQLTKTSRADVIAPTRSSISCPALTTSCSNRPRPRAQGFWAR